MKADNVFGQDTVLVFRVAECTNCHLCDDICYWKALDLSTKVDLAKALHNTSDTWLYPAGACEAESPDAKLKRLIQSMR